MGYFFTFEGGDGTGKSTQISMAADALRQRGYDVVTTREPGGTDLGQVFRQALLHGEDMSPITEALLFATDRSHHIATVVRPAMERGAIVLSDRYFDSSLAYQGAARSLGLDEVRSLNLWATGNLLPNQTFLLDLDASLSWARLSGEKDRLESAGDDFHGRVREQFLLLAEAEPERFTVLDAGRDREDLSSEIVSIILEQM